MRKSSELRGERRRTNRLGRHVGADKPSSKPKNSLNFDGLSIELDPLTSEIDEKGTVYLRIEPLFIDEEQAKKFLDKVKQAEIDKGEMNEEIKGFSPKGRVLRKAFERPRPDLPADAPINRTRKQISLALPPDLISEVNEAAKAHGVDRNSFIEAALRRMLQPK